MTRGPAKLLAKAARALLCVCLAAVPAPGQGSCVAVEQAKLVGSDTSGNDQVGAALCVQGDTILVGAYQDGGGSAYEFLRSGTTWTQTLAATSTEVWQKRQSMPSPATWCRWLYGTGCSRTTFCCVT